MKRHIAGLRFSVSIAACLWVLSAFVAADARAAGFYISEVGTRLSLGTAGAGNVTNTFGPDAAWANPAGLVSVESGTMFGGLQLIVPTMKFDMDVAEKGGREGGNAGDPAVVPSFYYSQALTENWHFGFGFCALQGGAPTMATTSPGVTERSTSISSMSCSWARR